jgi:hypothetical protein
MTVYVATWSHTWGEYTGTLGVYTTEDLARSELERCVPWSDHEVEAIDLDRPGALYADGSSPERHNRLDR